MQFTTFALSAFIGLAAVASSANVTDLVSQLPACSQSCLSTAATAVGCSSNDYSCMCDSQVSLTTNSSICMTTSCSVINVATTMKLVTEICVMEDGSSIASSISNATSTDTSTSSSASATSTSTGISAGSQIQLAGVGWAAVVGIVGYLAL